MGEFTLRSSFFFTLFLMLLYTTVIQRRVGCRNFLMMSEATLSADWAAKASIFRNAIHAVVPLTIIIINKHIIDLWPAALTWWNKLPEVTKVNSLTGLIRLSGIFDCSLLDCCDCLSVSVSESRGNFKMHLSVIHWHPSACLLQITAPASHCWQLLYAEFKSWCHVTGSDSFFFRERLSSQQVVSAESLCLCVCASMLLSCFALISWWINHTLLFSSALDKVKSDRRVLNWPVWPSQS